MAEQISEYFGDKIIGQERVRTLLSESFRNGRAAHAYLFSGPRGIGKAGIALEFASLLLCDNPTEKSCGVCEQCHLSRKLQHPDLHLVFPVPPPKKSSSEDDDEGEAEENLRDEVLDGIQKRTQELAKDPYISTFLPPNKKSEEKGEKKNRNDKIRIGQIRALLRTISRKPFQAKRKVSVIFHADYMDPRTLQAQNALLKTLEEPSADAFFLLITENEKALLPTIRSRCQRINVSPLSNREIISALIKQGVTEFQAESLAVISQGSIVRAKEFISPELEALQGKVFDFLAECAFCNPLRLPKAAEEMMDTENLPSNTGLDLLATLIKDLAMARADISSTLNKLSFLRYKDRIEKFLTAYPEADFEVALGAVEQAVNYLELGYTKPLVLFALGIKIQAALGTRTVSISKTQQYA